jgi:acyl carrier protein
VTESVKALVARICGTDEAALPDTATLPELGLDSLAVVEMSQRIKDQLGIDISEHELAELGSVEAIAQALAERGPDARAANTGAGR